MRNRYPILVAIASAATSIAVCAGVVGTVLWLHERWTAAGPVGVVLTYEIDLTSGPVPKQADLDQLLITLDQRINPGGERFAGVQAVDALRIHIAVYGHDPRSAERIERLLSAAGTLEFRILANERDHKALIELARAKQQIELRDATGGLLAWWVPVEEGCEGDLKGFGEIATRRVRREGREVLEVLVVKDDWDVDGRFLRSAAPSVDNRGRPCVEFTFSEKGGKLLSRLTSENVPDEITGFARRLGIILDGRLRSAPYVRGTIFDRGEITGEFTAQDVRDLAAVLNAGPLPAKLKRVEGDDVDQPR